MPLSTNGALAGFTRSVRRWFEQRFVTPTAAQRLAWPVVQQGHHLLLSAPTGHGKTLAAFLPLVDQLLQTPVRSGIQVLYVAPLRALTNDVRANLKSYLDDLEGGSTIRVAIRTGDTPAKERRLFQSKPPDVLLTTPESLALLLCHPPCARLFADVRWVIVDEVHQLADNKRGADLSLSLERLELITQRSPQRIGLSATCAPIQEVAQWLVGSDREVAVAVAPDSTQYDLAIEHLDLGPTDAGVPAYVPTLLEQLIPILLANRTTLIFTNLRSIAERLTWSLRRRLPQWKDAIALHHSALSTALRSETERKMKQGQLRVVVSSTSLELGIDIGSIDKVVLLHPTGGTARLLQRLGRSGHEPGRRRSGVQFTATMVELLEAVATAAAGDVTHLEPIRIPSHPLDVLAQHLVGLSMQQPLPANAAWGLVRRAYPFRNLSLADFADCLTYVTGGQRDMPVPARARWLDERLVVRGRKTERIYRTNAGTIYEEDTRDVHAAEDGRHLGKVPDGFASHLQPGDRFLLEGRTLEVASGGAEGLQVKSASGLPVFTRWAGRLWGMPPALAERIWLLRVRCRDAILDGPGRALEVLQREYRLNVPAAAALQGFLRQQEEQSEIPSRGLLVEKSPSPSGWGQLLAFHAPLPTPACEAIARVLAYRLGRSGRFQYVPGWLGFGLATPEAFEVSPTLLGEMLTPSGFRSDVERVVTNTPALRDRFTRVATTGLMILRQPLSGRRRVGGRNWAGRRLLHWLRFSEPTFPLLRQALRELLDEVYNVEVAEAYLTRLQDEPIRMRTLPQPSPFATSWQDANFFEQDNWWAHLVAQPGDGHARHELAAVQLRQGVQVAGDWLLTPQRVAIHVPTQSAVIADVHLGYDSARQAGGDAVPLFGWYDARCRMETLLANHQVRSIVFAGDLVEDGRHAHEVMELIDWLRERNLEVTLVLGNHDLRLPRLEGVRTCRELKLGDWIVRHDGNDDAAQLQVVGHHHPVLHSPRVGGRASCYLLAGNTLVLPAFSDEAAGVNVTSVRRWRQALCYAIVNEEVWDLGPVKDLSHAAASRSAAPTQCVSEGRPR